MVKGIHVFFVGSTIIMLFFLVALIAIRMFCRSEISMANIVRICPSYMAPFIVELAVGNYITKIFTVGRGWLVGCCDYLFAEGIDSLKQEHNEWEVGGELGGGFKYFLFSTLLGEMIHFDPIRPIYFEGVETTNQ